MTEIFQSMGKVLVAFSGGTDSTLLLKAAIDGLGRANVLAVTALSPLFPDRERVQARETAQGLGVDHVTIESNEMEVPGFCQNPINRCYLCKKELFEKLVRIARERAIPFVIEGSTMDDENDHRPGRIAIQELGIRSPLKEALLTKAEIREMSRELGLSTWDKPSFACLASRFPYGEEITPEGLRMVDEAEAFLFERGFRQVRVRHYRSLARIELLPEEMGRLLEEGLRQEVVGRLKAIGYKYITLDLQGFRSGSMNEVLR